MTVGFNQWHKKNSLPKTQLLNKNWEWLSTIYHANKTISAKIPSKFTVNFQASGRVNFNTDCNKLSGNFKATANNLSFDLNSLISTMMFCANSQTEEFLEPLDKISHYSINDQGQLILESQPYKIQMIFK